jgi:hypothetical protein
VSSLLASTGTADVAIRPLPALSKLRLIPPLETYPAVVSFCQTVLGKVVLLLVFGVGLAFATRLFFLPVLLALALITAFPAQRRLLVTFCTLTFAFATCWRAGSLSKAIDIAIVCVLAGVLFAAAVRLPQSWLGRRPLVCLLGGFTVAVLLVNYLPRESRVQNGLWDFLTVFALYIGAIGYSLLDRNSKNRDDFALQLGTYRAFWGMTVIPYPKGAAYLRRVESQTPETLAVSQIKGIKLLAWSLVLLLVWKSLVWVVHGYLRIPTYADLFVLSAERSPFSWWLGWAALISAFFEKLLDVSVWGHQIIATCRMAGFLALRNTWRPLESYTMAEFWNRYNYYFKELLVDFFFYPAFMRYFKRWPRLRLFAATFAAACLGNAFLHFFTSYMDSVQRFGLWKALVSFQTYLMYSAPLAVGIGISQLRNAKRKSGWIRGRLVPALCVMGFYSVLHVFDDDIGKYPLEEHFRFLGHLFNLTLW